MVVDYEYRGKTPDAPGPLACARAGASERDWYARAELSIRAYATERGFDPARVADVLSLTSPRVSVSRNVRIARHYLETGAPTSDTMWSVRAALAHYEDTGEIRGPKTGAFARALMGDPDAVVVDVWVLRAFDLRGWKSLTPKRYRDVSARIRRLATVLGWTPVECQAAMWTGIRATYGHKPTEVTMY